MSNERKQAVKNAMGKNLGIIVGYALFGTLIASQNWGGLQDVVPGEIYDWSRGMSMGILFPSNYILSFFKEGIILKDTLHTGGYNFWWWFNCIWSSGMFISNVIALLINTYVLKKI